MALYTLVALVALAVGAAAQSDGPNDPCYQQPPGYDQGVLPDGEACNTYTNFEPRTEPLVLLGEVVTCQRDLDFSCFCDGDYGGMTPRWIGCRYSRLGWLSPNLILQRLNDPFLLRFGLLQTLEEGDHVLAVEGVRFFKRNEDCFHLLFN